LCALAEQADGAVQFAAGRPAEALEALRRAQGRCAELDVPHACARVRVLAGQSLRALDDPDAALLEFEAARECFERLGAAPDLARVDALSAVEQVTSRPGGLT